MDIFKITNAWRAVGSLLNTRIGSALSQAFGQPVNQMASLVVSADNDVIPWTEFKTPLAESCLALVSTAGFYLDGDAPFDVDSARGDAGFRTIPSDIAADDLRIAHTHYSHARVKKDVNVLFPVDRLRELFQAGVIGRLAPSFYSFGFGGDLVEAFIGRPDGTAHQLAQALKAEQVDYVIMIPA